MNTLHLCRSCMKELPSWECENFDERFIYMFTFCTNIQISENESLPKQFCYDCTVKIESSFSYIQEAQRVNETLLNIQHGVTVEQNTKVATPDHNKHDEVIFDNRETSEVIFSKSNVVVSGKETNKECKKNIDSEKYECSVCKKKFLSKVWFEKHIRNQHGGKKHSCLQCLKTFQTPSQLSVHAVSHSEERKFACACGKRYKRRKELAIHARAHSDDRPYQCDHCDMRFKLRSVLKSHLLLHQPNKPFLCQACGWSFAQAGNLAVHMRTHSGVKPFACACGFRAATSSSLRRHELRHRALRPHTCRTCRKGFRDAGALTRHQRSHSGALPYQCPGCARAFADSWKRKTHLMRAHRVPLARIPRMRADPRAHGDIIRNIIAGC